MYNINVKYHSETIRCTDEHPFYTREKVRKWNNKLRRYDYNFENPKWKKASELDHNHYFGMKVNENSIIPEFYFDKVINQHKTNTVRSSNLPISIPRLNIHLALSDNNEKFPSGPIIGPSPGPTFDIDVAAPEIDVIKSKPVIESSAVIMKKMTKYM